MIHSEIREAILNICWQMVEDHLAYGSQGNVSVFDQATGHVIITPSAITYKNMLPEDICVLNLDGSIVESSWKATSEAALHLSLYRYRTDIKAIIHTHAPYATVFSVIHKPIPTILTESAMCLGGDVLVAPYFRPGTQAVADSAVNTIGSSSAVLLGNHGLVCVGENLDRAYETTLAAETSARITIMALSMGSAVMALNESEAKDLRQIYLSYYKATKT